MRFECCNPLAKYVPSVHVRGEVRGELRAKFGSSLVKIKPSWAFCSHLQQLVGDTISKDTLLCQMSRAGEVQSECRSDKHWHASGQWRSNQEMAPLHYIYRVCKCYLECSQALLWELSCSIFYLHCIVCKIFQKNNVDSHKSNPSESPTGNVWRTCYLFDHILISLWSGHF